MAINATPTRGAATFDDVADTNDVYGLIEKVGKQTFGEAKTSNRLARFDKGFLEYGTTIEDSLVLAAESRAYNPNASSATTPVMPKLVTRYLNDWVERDYPVSIKDEQVRAVLTGAMTVGDLASASLASLDAGERRDDYADMKAVFAKFATEWARDTQRVPLAEGATLTDLLERIRYVASDMSFDNALYTGIDPEEAVVQTETPTSKLVIVMPHALVNKLDVRVFAAMFNLEKGNIVPEIVPIDTDDGLVYITDEDAFGAITKFRDFGMVQNRNARSRDYLLSVTKMFYYNPIYKTAVIDASALD